MSRRIPAPPTSSMATVQQQVKTGFFDLPRELRDMIYKEYLLIDNEYHIMLEQQKREFALAHPCIARELQEIPGQVQSLHKVVFDARHLLKEQIVPEWQKWREDLDDARAAEIVHMRFEFQEYCVEVEIEFVPPGAHLGFDGRLNEEELFWQEICITRLKDERGYYKERLGPEDDLYERPFESSRECVGYIGTWALMTEGIFHSHVCQQDDSPHDKAPIVSSSSAFSFDTLESTHYCKYRWGALSMHYCEDPRAWEHILSCGSCAWLQPMVSWVNSKYGPPHSLGRVRNAALQRQLDPSRIYHDMLSRRHTCLI